MQSSFLSEYNTEYFNQKQLRCIIRSETVRFAEKKDKEQVLDLLDEMLCFVYKTMGKKPNHKPVVETGSEMFDKQLLDPSYKVLVADDDGKICGVSTVFFYPILRRGEYRAQLEEMVVTGSYRRKGVGSMLIQAALKYCKDNKVLSLRLNSGLELEHAHKFYERNGGKFTEKMFRFDIS